MFFGFVFFQLAATRSTNLCHAVETKTKQKKKTHREKQGRAGSEGARDWERWLERRRVFSNLHAGSWVTSARRGMRSKRGRSASRRDDEERFLGGGVLGNSDLGARRKGAQLNRHKALALGKRRDWRAALTEALVSCRSCSFGPSKWNY